MAISIADYGGGDLEATNLEVTSGTACTVTFVSTPANGDIILLQCVVRLDADSAGDEINFPAGFTVVHRHNDFGTATNSAMAQAYRVASGESGAAYKITMSGEMANGSAVGYVLTGSVGNVTYDSLEDSDVVITFNTTDNFTYDVGSTSTQANAACYGVTGMHGDSGGVSSSTNSHIVQYDSQPFNAGLISTEKIVSSAEQFTTTLTWLSAKQSAGGLMVYAEDGGGGTVLQDPIMAGIVPFPR